MVKKKTLQESKEKLPKPTEAQLQTQIVRELEVKGYFVYMNYQNIAGRFAGDSNSSSYGHYRSLVNQGWKKGIPDLTVIGRETNGNTVMLYIECKSEKGVLSGDQKYMLYTIKALGIETRVVRSLDQIQDLLDKDIIRAETLTYFLYDELPVFEELDEDLNKIQKLEQANGNKIKLKQVEEFKESLNKMQQLEQQDAKKLEKLNKNLNIIANLLKD